MADESLPAIFKEAEGRMQGAIAALNEHLKVMHTGRAHTGLVEHILVEYYGQPTPLNQVAGISVPEARLIVIAPWDKSILADIEKAIQKANIGITPSNDGQVIRLPIPPMSQERRLELIKQVHTRLEEHKVAVRNIRRDVQEKLRTLGKNKLLSEDELKREEEHLQKLTDKYIDEMDKHGELKEEELAKV